MKTQLIGKHLIRLEAVESTNNYAAKLTDLPKWENGTVIVADQQTQGRGQRGSKWVGEKGNLFFSLLLDLSFLSPDHSWKWSQAVAVALHEAASSFSSNPLWIKWPNDIIGSQGKIAGILIENSLSSRGVEHSVVGIGVNTRKAPENIPAAHLHIKDDSNNSFLNALCESLEKWYFLLKNGGETINMNFNSALWKYGEVCTIIPQNCESKEVLFKGTNLHGQAEFLSEAGILNYGVKDFEWGCLPY